MKDEVKKAKIINIFVGLKLKVYSLVTNNEEIKKSKVFNKNIATNVKEKKYLDVSFNKSGIKHKKKSK